MQTVYRISLVGVFALGLVSCQTIRTLSNPPQAKVDAIEFVGISGAKVDLAAWVKVKNENSFLIQAENVTYRFLLQEGRAQSGGQKEAQNRQLKDSKPKTSWKEVSSGSLPQSFEVAGNSEARFRVPVQLALGEVLRGAFAMLINEPLRYRFEGRARVSGWEVPFSGEGNLPSIDTPSRESSRQ